ncbi:hypothetical protein KTD33_15855 [Burkholderia gladioli]|uniref:hypothetical protein n=1 Tax=Burkholderia gladioli TaxID=28095 RepID=UPI001C2240E4|nr:hypothetical protein [Burkholderia gladioli]MBU9196000.1 hypothetical protein [Burkholderia gladioli]
MADESSKLTRRQHGYRIPADRNHYQQSSIKTEAKKLADEQGISLEEAFDRVLSTRREYARQLAEAAAAKRAAIRAYGRSKGEKRGESVSDADLATAMRPILFESIDGAHGTSKFRNFSVESSRFIDPIDPADVTRADVKKLESRKKFEKEWSRQQRVKLRDSLVLRADAFAAFVLILEKKGIPAHVIDERKFASIVVEKRWDLVPGIIAWMVREDSEVKGAFQVFCDAATKCTENLRVGVSKMGRVSGQASEIISEKYREMFLQAASIYARKLSHLESSLDRLDILPLDELQKLVDDGDQLSKRIADLSLRVADELKRREAKKGAATKDEKFDPIRKFALNLANDGSYPSRRQAVLAIKEQVLTYANSLGVSMSVQQSDKTIDGWLKDLGYTPSASKRGTSTS